MRLSGKVTLITGAGSGIGREMALVFAREGAMVIINDVSSENAQATVSEIEKSGGKADYIIADVSHTKQVDEMVKKILTHHQAIDVLVNNAGISCVGALHETTEEELDRVLRINLKGPMVMSQAVLPSMLKRKKGSIIHISSAVAEMGVMRRAVYTATKGALLSLTRAMQVDYAKDNIRVNAILPGTILTPFVENYLKTSYENPEEAIEQLKRRQLANDLGNPRDVAHAALFLASDESSFVMGTPLFVDGGFTSGKFA